jgi:DNA-binding NarL/FixJ family response regulator
VKQQLRWQLGKTHNHAPDGIFATDILERLRQSRNDLTVRKREILEVVAEGLDNYEIAARLDISENRGNHVSTIFSKLQIKSRAHAVALARDASLGGGIR